MKKIAALLFSLICLNFQAQKKWTLQEVVDYGVQHNLQVIQNSYNKQLQDKNLEITKREKLPFVSGSVGNSLSLGQGQDVFGNIRRNDNFNNNVNMSGNILLFNHGRLEKTVRKTEFEVEAIQYDIETIKNNISLQIAQQYLSALLSKEILKINQSAYENAQKMYNRAKITTEVGITPQTIVAEAAATLARENQNVKNAEININRNLFQLAQLLQLPDYHNFDVADVPVESILVSKYLGQENVLDKAYDNQPQIKAAESRIKVAEAQTEVVKTAFWPTVTASAGVGTFYFNSLVTNKIGYDVNGIPIPESGFFKQYKNNFGQQLGLNANIPIFNKGITKLQVEQAKINEEAAKASLEQAKQEIKQNVQKAQFDAEVNYEAYLAAAQAEISTKLALDFAQKSFEAGRTTIYDLTIARNNYANAQGSLAQAKYNYFFSLKLLNFYAGTPLAL